MLFLNVTCVARQWRLANIFSGIVLLRKIFWTWFFLLLILLLTLIGKSFVKYICLLNVKLSLLLLLSASHMVIYDTSLAQPVYMDLFLNMHELVLKSFFVLTYAPRITEVIWYPSIVSWIKCNIDGTTKGFPGSTVCVGI